MHGLGNDYIYVNCLGERILNPEMLAKKMSDRHFGVGADGLILICSSRKADFAMEMYNADGSPGEMCGNGIRCLGKYVYDRGLTRKRELDIETKAGIRHLWILDDQKPGCDLRAGQAAARAAEQGRGMMAGQGSLTMVRVDMGSPVLEADQVPVISEHTMAIDEPITVNGAQYRITGVSMGNPHAVVFTGKVKGLDLAWLGPAFEYHGRFPRRVNVEFVQVLDSRTLKVRVWERGSGETLACGTGACAAVAAGVLNHLTEREVTVKLTGGDLLVNWQEDTDKILLTGPAVHVYDGEYPLA